MVSWIIACIAFSAMCAGSFSFPIIEDHHELSIPETVVGHEDIGFGHQIGLSHGLHEFEPKHATSYQSFHLESKHHEPIEIKTIHPPSIKHFSGIGHESLGHSISEIEPLDFKLHGF